MKRVLCFAVLVLLGALVAVNVRTVSVKAQPAQAAAATPNPPLQDPMKMGGKAAIACRYERDLWIGHKYDQLDKIVTPNYTVHHTNEPDVHNREEWKAWAEKHPVNANMSRDNCPGVTTVVETPNYVFFVRWSHVPDPKDPTKTITRVGTIGWRFEGNKIAEHWG